MHKRWGKVARIGVIAGCFALAANSAMAGYGHGNKRHCRNNGDNVIIMIPDGCDETIQTVARWYKGEELAVDGMQQGAVKTHMADSIITDSAAASSAFATGYKTSNGFVSVGARSDTLLSGYDSAVTPYAPLATVLEAAKREGKAVGIVATSRVTHATPAGFTAHNASRNNTNEIMENIVYNNVDVVFGGGLRHLIPEGDTYTTSFGVDYSGKRTDGENLLEVLEDRGYQFVDSKEQMALVTSGKVWGLFDDSHMQPDIDRQYFASHEPSLAEMVEKAIEILSQDPDGFLLMVEGSQVDWAGHNNDPIYMVTDFLAFDDAVQVANDFADENRRTVVLAFPDHNTGGMKIGQYNAAVGYTSTKVEDLIDPLMGMKMSANGVVAMMSDDSDEALVNSVYTNWAIELTDDDLVEIRELESSVGLSYALARVVSKNHTIIGWTTHGHTGETVPLWMVGEQAPARVIDNTDLAYMAADVIGANLDKTTEKLYVDLDTVTSNYVIDETYDAENPVLVVAGAELPIGKDYMVKDGQTYQLPGLTVYAPATGKVYISETAIRKLRLH